MDTVEPVLDTAGSALDTVDLTPETVDPVPGVYLTLRLLLKCISLLSRVEAEVERMSLDICSVTSRAGMPNRGLWFGICIVV